MKQILISLLLIAYASNINGQSLSKAIENVLEEYDAEVGVAVIYGGDTVVVNDGRYPMNSVIKLYQAAAVMSLCDIDSIISVKAMELHTDTYSPMLNDYAGRDFEISIADLLGYSLSLSDNNACDLLFNHTLSVAQVNAFIHSLGIDNVSIRHDENAMHQDHALSDENWNSPLAAAMLINRLLMGDIITDEYVKDMLMLFMADNNETGENRLQKPLIDTKIAHKTGTGFNDDDGHPQGVNDVGFVFFPGGYYSIAVFIKSTFYDLTTTEGIIEEISNITYQHILLDSKDIVPKH